MTLTGQVIEKRVAIGSKSERDAICLLCTLPGSSQAFILRRVGGHPFKDPTLQGLLGKAITADGNLKFPTFFMTSWKVH